MMSVVRATLFIFLLSVCGFAESNTVAVVSGGYSNSPGGVIVGFTGTNNALTVNNGGILNTTNFSAVGIMSEACFNAATVTGSGSIWSSGAGLYVGGFGSFNQLAISASGRVIVSNTAFMGMDAVSSNNSMLITGSGSEFVQSGPREFDIGFAGSGNSVTVSNGGKLSARQVVVGLQETAAGNSLLVYGGVVTSDWIYVGEDGGFSNRVLLTGASSILYASNTFACGVSGRASRVEILNGARIESGWGRIGWEVGGNSNIVLVDGSTWSNRNEFDLGLRGSFNTLVITNGGKVWTGGWNPIGMEAGCVGNTAIVTGPGSSWVITNVFLVGQAGSSNRLEIRNGASVSNGWFAFISDSSNSHGNSVLVTGTNTRWVSRDTLWLGEYSGRNRLELRDGAFLSASNAYLGSGSTDWTGNVIEVSGPGTIWTNTGMVDVRGLDTSLAVSNGATVYAQEVRANAGFGDTPSPVVIDGSNTQWFCSGRVGAGLWSSYGNILVTNGGRLFSADGMIGLGNFEWSNRVVVTGSGSVWSNSGDLCVGYDGIENSMLVERGGRVYSANASVGEYTGGRYNVARVTGSNSSWLCLGSLLVGDSDHNSLLIESGGVYSCASAVVGLDVSNKIVITGAGSSWSNSGGLVISSGTYADNCGFAVSNGALAYSEHAVIGERKGSSSYAVVTSPGSMWSNVSSLWIGQTGRYNRLTVENGGRLFSGSAVLGIATASVENIVTVAGPDSSWSNAGSLVVGQGSSSNALVIGAGARVDAGSVIVGALGTARGCSIQLQTGTLVAAAGLVINTNALLTGVGTVTVSSASIDNYGIVSPGLSPGRLLVNGSFVQKPGGVLNIELGGREMGVTHDQLLCMGALTIDGSLNVLRLRGFVPANGDIFTVAASSSLTGAFAVTNYPPWFSWGVLYVGDSVLVRVTGVETATNGVPKAWLADYGWTNNFDAAATNDADHDRVATWEEYYAGTDPTNPASFFQCLEISKTNLPTLGKILRWNAVTGRVYAVEGSTNPLSPSWTELTNNLAAPVNAWTDAAPGSANVQYRLRVGGL